MRATPRTAAVKSSIPFALSTLVGGIAFGIIASRIGLGAPEAALMSALAFSGTAQLTAVQLWSDPLPLATILLAAAAVNGRYLAMGAMLRGKIEHHSLLARYSLLALLTDAGWVLALRADREGRDPWPVLLASSCLLYGGWVAGTFLGGLAVGMPLGTLLLAAEFLGLSMLAALVPDFWKGRADVLSCAVAAAVAIGLRETFPGSLSILVGGLSGTLLRLRMVR